MKKRLAVLLAALGVFLLPTTAGAVVRPEAKAPIVVTDQCEFYGSSGRRICAQLRIDNPLAFARGRIEMMSTNDIFKYEKVQLLRNGVVVRSSSTQWRGPGFTSSNHQTTGFNYVLKPGNYKVIARIRISGAGADGHLQTVETSTWHLS